MTIVLRVMDALLRMFMVCGLSMELAIVRAKQRCAQRELCEARQNGTFMSESMLCVADQVDEYERQADALRTELRAMGVL